LCDARILKSLTEKNEASKELARKYAQYREGDYFPDNLEEAVIVKLTPKRAVFWQNLHPSLA
jgi:hypothetical protein